MLPGHFSDVAQVNVNMPHHFNLLFGCLLLVICWRSANYAVELLHEEAPVSPLEHCKPTVVKTLRVYLRWLFLEINYVISTTLSQILTLKCSILVELKNLSVISEKRKKPSHQRNVRDASMLAGTARP